MYRGERSRPGVSAGVGGGGGGAQEVAIAQVASSGYLRGRTQMAMIKGGAAPKMMTHEDDEEQFAQFQADNDATLDLSEIRAGVEAIIFTGRADVAERLADIVRQRGACLLTERPAAVLDLAAEFFAAPEILQRRCAVILASSAVFC